MIKTKFKCLFCGKEEEYLRHSRERKFCCDSHRQLFYQKKIRIKCEECGKTIDFRSTLCRKCARAKEKNPNWKGGITPQNRVERNSIEYRLWRESVFARDNWTCQHCGVRGGNLESHHVKSFAKFPELRVAIDNGLTLCCECHNETKKKR